MSLAKEIFKSNLEFRYQFIVSSITLRKGFVKFTDSRDRRHVTVLATQVNKFTAVM